EYEGATAQGMRHEIGLLLLRIIRLPMRSLTCSELDLLHTLLPWAFNQHGIDRKHLSPYLRHLIASSPCPQQPLAKPFLLAFTESYDAFYGHTRLAARARHALFDLANLVVKAD